MAYELNSFKVDRDGKIRIRHVAYGETLEEAESNMQAHADDCPVFGPEYNADRTIDMILEIDELPEPAEDQIREFLGIDE